MYLYNSQSTIELDKVRNKASIEGQEINLDHLLISKEGEYEGNKIIIAPEPFDENDVVDWKLSYDGNEKNIILKDHLIKRVRIQRNICMMKMDYKLNYF